MKLREEELAEEAAYRFKTEENRGEKTSYNRSNTGSDQRQKKTAIYAKSQEESSLEKNHWKIYFFSTDRKASNESEQPR